MITLDTPRVDPSVVKYVRRYLARENRRRQSRRYLFVARGKGLRRPYTIVTVPLDDRRPTRQVDLTASEFEAFAWGGGL